MDARTKFARGEVVRAAYSTQGMISGRKYLVKDVVVQDLGLHGGLTTYYVQELKKGTGAPELRIVNGHIVLSKVVVEPQVEA